MSNELMIADEHKIALLSKQEVSEVIKPLKQEIHLFDTHIAGTLSIKDPEALASLEVGDKLTLRREDCLYDENRIVILNEAGIKLGNVPESENVVFAKLLDAGKLLIGRVKGKEKTRHMEVVSIGIYLVDF